MTARRGGEIIPGERCHRRAPWVNGQYLAQQNTSLRLQVASWQHSHESGQGKLRERDVEQRGHGIDEPEGEKGDQPVHFCSEENNSM